MVVVCVSCTTCFELRFEKFKFSCILVGYVQTAKLDSVNRQSANLKCYYDQKITFIFSSDFETMFVKHSPSEIISLNFEKKTVNLNCNLTGLMVRHYYTRKDTMTSYTQEL